LSIFKSKLFIALCSLALCAAAPCWAWAHAFPDHAEPRVGAVITISPTRVRIWFDGVLEPLFSTLQVHNTSDQQVDRGDGHVDTSDQTLLEVNLLPLSPGTYRVFWSVVARDGHRTQGDYTFTLH
jgi:copper resistance protein C